MLRGAARASRRAAACSRRDRRRRAGGSAARRSPADVVHLDPTLAAAAIGPGEAAQLRVAVAALLPDEADGRRDLGVARAAAHERAQVVAAAGEQAEKELALGREARAVAVAAERARHARDRADLAGDAGIGVAPALGSLAGRGGGQGDERELLLDPANDLARRQHLVQTPTVARAD